MKNALGRGSAPVQFVGEGDRFGRLTVVVPEVRHIVPSRPRGIRSAVVQCDCGKELTVALDRLLGGWTQSCGCLRADLLVARARRHGLYDHPLYGTHHGMMRRCYDPGHGHYRNYGGRGIGVCDRWHDVRLFIEDIEREIGPRPEGMTIDRIDNDGNYEPGNVRWATLSEQRRNQRPHESAPRTVCKRGRHELTANNIYIDSDGHARCRECARERQRRYKAARRTWCEAIARVNRVALDAPFGLYRYVTVSTPGVLATVSATAGSPGAEESVIRIEAREGWTATVGEEKGQMVIRVVKAPEVPGGR